MDVLDAEQELFAAKVNLVRAQRDAVVAKYQLVAVLGKLTATGLNFKSEIYNPEENFDDVKYKFIGF